MSCLMTVVIPSDFIPSDLILEQLCRLLFTNYHSPDTSDQA